MRRMSKWVVLLHVAIAFWFVAGIVGRNLTFAKIRGTSDIRVLDALVALAGRFERLMVVPGSFAVLVAGLLAAWAQDRPLAGAGNGWLLVSLLLFLSQIPLIPLIFLPRGKVFESALEDAKRRGEVTPELSVALRDPAVAAARTYEIVTIAAIISLMVTKPF
jgi:Predicted integral membrane protein (DUF2269)